VWSFVGYFNTADMHRTCCGLLHSADDIKQGGLTGTVGTDESSDFAGLHIKVDPTNGHHTAKAHHDSTNFKK
jgi:hypothetical protein